MSLNADSRAFTGAVSMPRAAVRIAVPTFMRLAGPRPVFMVIMLIVLLFRLLCVVQFRLEPPHTHREAARGRGEVPPHSRDYDARRAARQSSHRRARLPRASDDYCAWSGSWQRL